MRILHTSDWHIGQKIHEHNRIDEHSRFLDWLLGVITSRNVDVLLVSGDVFDSSVPPADATDLYYRFLYDLHKNSDAKAVIIAGNHDSALRLAAPKEFLKLGGIYVVGGIQKSPLECVVSLDIRGKTAAFAAVPYLDEGDLLSHVSLEDSIERSLRYREAIRKVYEDCLSEMENADVRILMGHFFVQGCTAGESERLVHIGGIQPVRTDDLPAKVDYIALGHLHRPQQVRGNGCPPIQYPGSPIPLNFKEADYDKKVILLDFGSSCTVEELTVPTFRKLVRVEGTLDDVMLRVNFEDWKDKYVEVKLRLDSPQIGVGDSIRKAFAGRGGKVLVVESELPGSIEDGPLSPEDIKTRSPAEIFQSFYRSRVGDTAPDGELDELLLTFNELINICKNQEGTS